MSSIPYHTMFESLSVSLSLPSWVHVFYSVVSQGSLYWILHSNSILWVHACLVFFGKKLNLSAKFFLYYSYQRLHVYHIYWLWIYLYGSQRMWTLPNMFYSSHQNCWLGNFTIKIISKKCCFFKFGVNFEFVYCTKCCCTPGLCYIPLCISRILCRKG